MSHELTNSAQVNCRRLAMIIGRNSLELMITNTELDTSCAANKPLNGGYAAQSGHIGGKFI